MSTESGFYVMPAASQSEPQDAYGEAEKTNTEGCPFWILDAFPSHKYQSSPGTLQNQFTLNRPAILPYKDLKTLGFRSCVYVYTCQSALTVGLLVKVGPAVRSLLSLWEGVFGSATDALGQLNTDEENIPQLPLGLMLFHNCNCNRNCNIHKHRNLLVVGLN